MRSTLRSTRHSRAVPVGARDVGRERRDLEIVLDVDRQGVGEVRMPRGLRRLRVICRSAAARRAAAATARGRSRCGRPHARPTARARARACRGRRRISATPCRMACAIAADQRVRALLDGDRPLGVLAQRQAGHAERGGLFLQAAGVGEHERCAGHQPEHLQVALRRQQQHARRIDEVAECRTARCWRAFADAARRRAAVARRDFAQHAEQRTQRLRIVDVRRPVQRHDAIALRDGRAPRGRCRARARCRRRCARACGSRAASRSSRCRRSPRVRRATPSRRRLSSALRSVVYSRSASWSVRTRLISSGILRS